MKCPSTADWDLLAMEALQGEQAQQLLEHAHACPACRERYQAARRNHVERVRMYEAFDRDHDELREQLLAALPDEPPRPARSGWVRRSGHRLGDVLMSLNNTATRRAAAVLLPAACIVIAVVLFVGPTQKSAFAAAIEHLKRASTVVCRITMPDMDYFGTKIKSEGKLLVSAEYGAYSEMFVNGMAATRSYAPPDGPALILQPMMQTYLELDSQDLDESSLTDRTPDGWLRKLAELTEDSAAELRTEQVDGHEAIGYRIPGEKLGYAKPTDPQAEEAYGELWVDTKTQLPVRVFISIPMPAADSTLKLIFDRFEWDVPLDASLFEPDLEGYLKLDVRYTRPTEEALLHSLNTVRELTGGRYPSTLESVGLLAELHTIVRQEAVAKLREMDMQQITQLGIEIGAGGRFFQKLVREGREPEYFGGTVTDADADEVLLRWTLEDGNLRVIYGDLRIETVQKPD